MKREKPLGTDEVIMECVKDAGLEETKAGQVRRKEGDEIHLFVTYKRDPFGLDKGPTTHQFGCDVKENTDTRLVVAFPSSPVLTPELAVGQPGQVARFEFTKRTKKNKTQHGRRADVVFVA